ncbi:hypothetical protein LQW54_001303 [Pestalotiopsis sp. IQ-011]
MSKTLSAEEISVFKELFDTYDPDKDGSITVEEFAKVMSQSPGQPPSEEEVKKIIDEVDLDGDGTINFNEFITMMTGQPYPPPTATEKPAAAEDPVVVEPADELYASAWREYEPSLNGSVTQAQFRQLLSGLAETATDAEIDQLLSNVDGEGKISYRDFLHFIKNRNVEDDILSGYQ